MTTTIALAGKGGVGKTTIAGLIIRYLTKIQSKPVLAIDADPSSNLNIVLGMDLEATVGDIREGLLKEVQQSLQYSGAAMGTLPGGITKHDYLDLQIRSSLEEFIIHGLKYALICLYLRILIKNMLKRQYVQWEISRYILIMEVNSTAIQTVL